MADTDINDSILDNANGPLKVTGDAGSVEQHPLPDQIAAAKFLANKAAIAKNKGLGIKFVRMNPPGAV